jgi:hypothetical protein
MKNKFNFPNTNVLTFQNLNNSGARRQNWTADTRLFRPLLYHWATLAYYILWIFTSPTHSAIQRSCSTTELPWLIIFCGYLLHRLTPLYSGAALPLSYPGLLYSVDIYFADSLRFSGAALPLSYPGINWWAFTSPTHSALAELLYHWATLV